VRRAGSRKCQPGCVINRAARVSERLYYRHSTLCSGSSPAVAFLSTKKIKTARMPVLQRLLHALCDDFLNRIAVIDLQPLLSGNNQSPRIQAQLVQYRGMNVGHVMPILDGVEA